MRKFTIILTILVLVTFSGFTPSLQAADPPVRNRADISFYVPPEDNSSYQNIAGYSPKNVIMLIGDGMGISQTTVARMKALGSDGKLYMEKLPITGLIRTHSSNSVITDSAAAGTALACGIKTNNGYLGLDPAGNKYMNIMECVREKGMRTGVVATNDVNCATPAAFSSHVRSRNYNNRIAAQQAKSNLDVLLGGGRVYFIPKSTPGSKRKDELDLISQMKTAGYTYAASRDELMQADCEKLVGLFANEEMSTWQPEPTLAEMTRKAIEILARSDNGFFLMVEGSQIDSACHRNNFDYAVRQTLLFDMAVREAVEYAITHKDTLVIVTADHETAGLTIPSPPKDCRRINKGSVKWAWKGLSSKYHTATPVAVYSFGPGANDFTGVQDNTELPRKIAKALKLPQFPRKVEEIPCNN